MRKSGFTLVEMLAVLVIIALLAAALTFGLSRARNSAWRHKALETCTQLCTAWDTYLLDVHKFPFTISSNGKKFSADYENLKWIVSPEWLSKEEQKRHTGKIYLEISKEEKEKGLKDPWGNPIWFSLDMDYDGEVENPYPNAFDPPVAKAKGNVIAWSDGDPKYAKRDDNPIIYMKVE